MPLKGQAPRLCLVIEAGPGPALLEGTEAALEAVEVASLVIAPAPGGALDAATAKHMVGLAQARGVAALIEADAGLARALEADGVHLSWSDDLGAAYAATRNGLGPGFIVGADAGLSRHDAMTLAEAGADYVGYGIPPHVTDRETARARRHDLIAWWAEVFEVPVVAFDVETAEDARHLARAGADFIAVRIAHALPPADLKSWLSEFSAAMERSPVS
jgi:thiamine-phosphate pyrophosphorylase